MSTLTRHFMARNPTQTMHKATLLFNLALVTFTLSGPWLTQANAATPAPLIEVSPNQIQAMGLKTFQVVAGNHGASTRYPATVVVPAVQQRIVAAPLPGLVSSLRASVGENVRSGQVLAVVQSTQAQELQRDLHISSSQSSLQIGTLARDEQLYKEGLIALSRLEMSRSQARDAQIQQQARQRAAAEAGASAQGLGGQLPLVSPISGVILAREAVVGQRVDQATPLFRIANLSQLWIELQVPAREAASIKLGHEVRVLGTHTPARVIAVGSTVEMASQTVLVRAALPPSTTDVRAGQAIEVELTRLDTDVAAVPAAAVLTDADRSVVFVEAGPGQYRVLVVQYVSASGGTTYVRGLPVNSKVVVQGTAAMKSMLAASRP